MTGNSKPSNGFLSDELYRFLVCVRHRREKKKRRSRDRLRKKRRHRSRSRSASESSRSRSRSRSESRVSPITSAVRKLAAGNVTKQLLLQPFVYLSRFLFLEASKNGSGTSSPLPSQLLTVQPAFAKIAEVRSLSNYWEFYQGINTFCNWQGIRAKVIAMIEGDKK